MAGDKDLTFNQLAEVAKFFGRGVLFFLEDTPVDETIVHSPGFRTLANQKPELSPTVKRLIQRVERQRDVYLSLIEDLDETEHPQFTPPDLPRNHPEKTAAIARAWLGLGDSNTFETYRAAVEAKGILVFRSNGYKGEWQIPKESPILGFALYDSFCPVIVVKKEASESRQSFTLMHELGHLLLHKSSSIDDAHDLQSHEGWERDANAFAGHILVPDSLLGTIRDKDRPNDVAEYDDWLAPQRKAWGVSGEVILRRLLDIGRLAQGKYTAYRKWRDTLTFPPADGGLRVRFREPKHVFGDTFVRTILDALNSRRITLARASSHLDGLKIKDLHRLESLYAGL